MNISETIPSAYQDNSAYMNVISRTSVRRFADRAVSDDQVSALLHAAMSAPSGVNRQPWEYIVVDDRATLKRLANALPFAKMAAAAPLAIIVCGNSERFLDGADSTLWEQDLSAASENILLAAHAIGLGGVWTCIYPHDERIAPVRTILNIPDHIIPFNLIPIGYPLANHPPMSKWTDTRIHLNSWPGDL